MEETADEDGVCEQLPDCIVVVIIERCVTVRTYVVPRHHLGAALPTFDVLARSLSAAATRADAKEWPSSPPCPEGHRLRDSYVTWFERAVVKLDIKPVEHADGGGVVLRAPTSATLVVLTNDPDRDSSDDDEYDDY